MECKRLSEEYGLSLGRRLTCPASDNWEAAAPCTSPRTKLAGHMLPIMESVIAHDMAIWTCDAKTYNDLEVL